MKKWDSDEKVLDKLQMEYQTKRRADQRYSARCGEYLKFFKAKRKIKLVGSIIYAEYKYIAVLRTNSRQPLDDTYCVPAEKIVEIKEIYD